MDNPHKGRTGLDRIRHAAGYSLQGLIGAYRHESAFRQELWLAALMLPLAFWLGRTWVEVALLAGSVGRRAVEPPGRRLKIRPRSRRSRRCGCG